MLGFVWLWLLAGVVVPIGPDNLDGQFIHRRFSDVGHRNTYGDPRTRIDLFEFDTRDTKINIRAKLAARCYVHVPDCFQGTLGRSSCINDSGNKAAKTKNANKNLPSIYTASFIGGLCHAPLLAQFILFLGLGALAVWWGVEVSMMGSISICVIAFAAAQWISACHP